MQPVIFKTLLFKSWLPICPAPPPRLADCSFHTSHAILLWAPQLCSALSQLRTPLAVHCNSLQQCVLTLPQRLFLGYGGRGKGELGGRGGGGRAGRRGHNKMFTPTHTTHYLLGHCSKRARSAQGLYCVPQRAASLLDLPPEPNTQL